MKVLILGVNGFIGSHLTDRILLGTDWEVVGMDLANGKVKEHLNSPRFTFFQGDISLSGEWIESQVEHCDIVLPLVAIATPKVYVTDPLRVFELDFEENLKVVKHCAKHHKRLLFPSTSEVYGMCPDAEFDEEQSNLVTGPISKNRWIYSTSKQLLDRVIWAHGFQKGLQFTLFRPFNWMGPRLDSLAAAKGGSSRLVTQFTANLLNGEPLNLVDGGYARRCFCDISDAMDGLMAILANQGGRADGKIFNIGNPSNEKSVREIAEAMIEIWNSHPFRKQMGLKEGSLKETKSGEYYGEGYQDVSRRVPSIRRMQETFGFSPKVGLRESLEKAMNFFIEEFKSTT
ncbi:MAG: bifunctional UDP-4-keto-pentose/UDP-xylose synthase [Holophagales bacterium]|nr:bifunctional UDP-4-keto-pentose/UDP-xylose synthase [Holophagales bacterium]